MIKNSSEDDEMNKGAVLLWLYLVFSFIYIGIQNKNIEISYLLSFLIILIH